MNTEQVRLSAQNPITHKGVTITLKDIKKNGASPLKSHKSVANVFCAHLEFSYRTRNGDIHRELFPLRCSEVGKKIFEAKSFPEQVLVHIHVVLVDKEKKELIVVLVTK